MSNKKALFFDIDGTLLTAHPFQIPESTRQALKEAQAKGHKCFINTGRTFALVPDMLKELNFDGYVCGCGSQIYINNELLHSCTIPYELCEETVKMARECNVTGFFERPEKLFYDSGVPASKRLTGKLDSLRKQIPVEDLNELDKKTPETFSFAKFLVFILPESDMKKFREFCDRHFTCFEHTEGAWEFTRKDCSKATGIRFVLEQLNLSLEDSYAFGDSNNDLPMLKYAGTSVAMGNCNPDILPYCTYKTTDIKDNGIYNALKHFELI